VLGIMLAGCTLVTFRVRCSAHSIG
jgi:hypothetical protein